MRIQFFHAPLAVRRGTGLALGLGLVLLGGCGTSGPAGGGSEPLLSSESIEAGQSRFGDGGSCR